MTDPVTEMSRLGGRRQGGYGSVSGDEPSSCHTSTATPSNRDTGMSASEVFACSALLVIKVFDPTFTVGLMSSAAKMIKEETQARLNRHGYGLNR